MQQNWLRSGQIVSLCDRMAPFMHGIALLMLSEK